MMMANHFFLEWKENINFNGIKRNIQRRALNERFSSFVAFFLILFLGSVFQILRSSRLFHQMEMEREKRMLSDREYSKWRQLVGSRHDEVYEIEGKYCAWERHRTILKALIHQTKKFSREIASIQLIGDLTDGWRRCWLSLQFFHSLKLFWCCCFFWKRMSFKTSLRDASSARDGDFLWLVPSNRLRIREYLVLIFDRLKSEIMKGRFFCFYLFWKCQRKNKSFFIIFNHQFYLISFFAHFLFTILNVKYCWDLINEYFSKTFLSSFSSLCVWGSGVSSGSG